MVEMLIECLKARDIVIWLRTAEEDRASAQVCEAAQKQSLEVFCWDSVSGLRSALNPDIRPPACDGSGNIDNVLRALESYDGVPAVFMLRDMPALFDRIHQAPEFVAFARRIKRMAKQFKAGRNALVFVCGQSTVPPEIEACVRVIDSRLPTPDELLLMIHEWLGTNGLQDRCRLEKEGLARLAQGFSGLTMDQACSVLAHTLVRRKYITEEALDDVVAEKGQIIKKTAVLELIQPDETLEDMGGLSLLKDWLAKRSAALSAAAREYGLPTLRGILLVGVPGTGKSLTAKAIASIWHLPLLRLDVGRLFGSLVGESEARWRQAAQIIETVAPCVLYIDEMEKAFGGMAGPGGDGGVGQRVLGGFLTWMQEKTAPVFIAATANDIEMLPPELLRKGRWDDLFFVDLPNIRERREILEIQLRRYGRDSDGLVSDRLLMQMDKFSGAEIEQVVKEALFEAFSDGQRDITLDDLEDATTRIVPIADQMPGKIARLREWGHRHARLASPEK